MTRSLIVSMTLASCLMFSQLALADVTAAAKAFTDGQAAQVAGDYALAAEKFELAHTIMPSAAALRSATRMRLKADHLAAAATHAEELLARYPDDQESRSAAEQVLEQVSGSLTRIDVTCSQPCTVSVDQRAVGMQKQREHLFYTRPGTTTIQAWFDPEVSTSKQLEALAGQQVALVLAPDEPEPVPSSKEKPEPAKPRPAAKLASPTPAKSPTSSTGLHPAWFYTGLALTTAAGGVALWSGLETKSLRRDFDKQPTQKTYDEGVDSQLRTNMLIGATGTLGLTTLIFALVTDWDEPTEERPVAIGPLGVWGRF